MGPTSRGGPGRDTMEIAYTEEQQALKSELRAYYENLLTPEIEPELAQAGGIGPAVRKVVKQMGSRRLARHRLAQGVGRAGPLGHRAVHLLRRVDAQRGAGAHADHQHRRADHHAVRNPGAEGVLPPEDPGRGDPFLHRLHGAQRGNRPGLAGHQGRTRRRGVRHQRVQDVHQPGRRRRLHLVGHPHRSRTSPSTRASPCSSSPWTRPASAWCR